MAKAEFFVDQVSVEGDFVLVNGVVNRGSVRVGTTFSLIKASGDAKPGRTPAQIVVVGIVSYRRERELLHFRNDGTLKVAGEGVSLVKENDLLCE